jgi:tRNA(Arg) A34 adenosine deaminase TadA
MFRRCRSPCVHSPAVSLQSDTQQTPRLSESRIRQPGEHAKTRTLSASDFSRIARAIKYAEQSRLRVRVGAVVADGKTLSGACNRERNDPRLGYLSASVHAEVGALRRAGSAVGSTVYVARLGSRGRLLPSFPCPRCMSALVSHGVRRVVWWDGFVWIGTKISQI